MVRSLYLSNNLLPIFGSKLNSFCQNLLFENPFSALLCIQDYHKYRLENFIAFISGVVVNTVESSLL